MKKIMFNDKYCLTQAVLTGVKTMTRRKFARFRPDARMFDEICNIEGGFDDKGRYIFTLYNENGDIIGDMIPHYNVGEVVAIAQPYKDIYPNADFEMVGDGFMKESAGWTNKMLVRANLMKRHIRITDVKVERLQDISDEDILREGVWQFYDNKKLFYVSKNIGYAPDVAFLTAREAFWFLIDKVSGKGTWESNPFVVAYSFELVD
ncbi:hypothetical protein [Prevotella nigrescens]|uniref:hypothetical protein n=1 Tax=Prevotella nigrescens TaxID=28133 RepID=UPI00242CC402|nr:hypothetical protein [Prevotella nigrescens]